MNPLNPTHDPQRRSWVESANLPGHDFPIQNLPFGAFRRTGEKFGTAHQQTDGDARSGVAIGDCILDLKGLLDTRLLDGDAASACEAALGGELNQLMGMEPRYPAALRARLSELLRGDSPELARMRAAAPGLLVPRADATMLLPCRIGDYSDFLTSLHHTERHGRFKGLSDPLPAAFKSLPIAYHGRASSIRISGAPVIRPNGQYRDAQGAICFGPAPAFDFELELAAFIGSGNVLGQPIPVDSARTHIFGYCLLNDWSAKSIQWWEQVLGPFLGKSFHSTISPWIVTEEALLPFRLPAPRRPAGDPPPLPHLHGAHDQASGGLQLQLEARLSSARGRAAGRPPMRITQTHLQNLYWTFAQMVAHHTSNGCNLRPGDLIGSGTISGESDLSRACLTELTNAGRDPLQIGGGETRTALEDGDEIILSARAERAGAVAIGFGECRGMIVAAPDLAAAACTRRGGARESIPAPAQEPEA